MFFRESGIPKRIESFKGLASSCGPGPAFPLEINALGGVRLSERKPLLSTKVGLIQERKGNLERQVFTGTESPTESQHGIRKRFPREREPFC